MLVNEATLTLCKPAGMVIMMIIGTVIPTAAPRTTARYREFKYISGFS
jgi:hypothetical protein